MKSIPGFFKSLEASPFKPRGILYYAILFYALLFLPLSSLTAIAEAETYSFVTKWGSEGSGDGQFYLPRGIAVDSSGYVYVTDTDIGVQKFTSDGTFVTKWGRHGSGDGWIDGSQSIAVYSNGYVYIVDAVKYQVQKFASDGTFVTQWGS
ncbi:MAG: hypothetical protein HQK99_17670 [Nitrospirae bacterium]|nr:hypothetical protein [Nitrospirota bacterium]